MSCSNHNSNKMSEKKKILVTGGTGMVGRAIQSIVEMNPNPNEDWIFLGSKDGDLTDAVQTKAIFDKYKPTHVIHLAALLGSLFYNMTHNVQLLRVNLQINNNVLHTCYKTGVKKVVSCLSSCIFADKEKYPIDETMIHDGPPHATNFGYSYAKRIIDIQNHAYHEQYNCQFTSVIPCNVFGPHDNFKQGQSHVFPELLARIHKAKLEKIDEVSVFGTGTPLRQFIYSFDMAKLIIWALWEYEDIDPIMLVDDNAEISIRQLTEMLVDACDYKGKLVFDTTKCDGQFKKTASNAKLRSLLPDFKFTPFPEAIKLTVEWYNKNWKTAKC